MADPETGTQNSDPNNSGTAATTTTATTVESAKGVLTDNSGNSNWYNGMPDDLAGHPTLEKFKDKTPHDLFKSYVNLEKMVGANTVAIPGADATPEQMSEFYSKLGRPDTPEGYKFQALPDAVAAAPGAADMDKGFTDTVFKAGLRPEQAAAIRDWYLQQTMQVMEQTALQKAGQYDEAVGKLKKEWGDKFDANVASAKRVLRKFGDPEITAHLEQTGLTNDPVLVKFLSKIGGAMTDDVFVGNPGSGGGNDFLSGEMAKKQIEKVMADRSHPYHDVTHADHKTAVENMARLFNIAYPSTQQQQ